MSSHQIVLDDLDKAIISILLKDAKTPFSKIARQLNVSEATVHLRIRKLRESGVLKAFKAILDYKKLGYDIISYVLVKVHPKKIVSVGKELQNIKEVIEVHDVTGRYQYLLKIYAKNHEELSYIIRKLSNIDGIDELYTMIVLRTLKEEEPGIE